MSQFQTERIHQTASLASIFHSLVDIKQAKQSPSTHLIIPVNQRQKGLLKRVTEQVVAKTDAFNLFEVTFISCVLLYGSELCSKRASEHSFGSFGVRQSEAFLYHEFMERQQTRSENKVSDSYIHLVSYSETCRYEPSTLQVNMTG